MSLFLQEELNTAGDLPGDLVCPGDLVLHLEKDITPRRIYPKAIVKEVITNSDGHVRRAFIRLPDGKILLRDIRKLALLEASDR